MANRHIRHARLPRTKPATNTGPLPSFLNILQGIFNAMAADARTLKLEQTDSRYSAIFNASKGSTVTPPIQRHQCAKAHDQMAFGSNSPCQTYSVVVMSSLHEHLPFADWFGF